MAYYSCVDRSEYGEKGGSDNIEFNIDHGDAESGGGACSSPPLWGDSKMSNNKKMMRSARVEAIARGQKELMEMVKSMPDSSYELSLRDLVDHHQKLGFQQNNNKKKKQQASVRKLQGSSRQTSTSKNYKTGGGLLLKMVFPALPLGATQKSKEIPTYSHTTTAAGGFSSHGSTGSSDTTVTVSSNSTRKKGGLLCGCSPFHSNKKKIVE
ncbi:hypothetical protein DCAR_0311652 [Daucus carota subsp. sativus]|uniref:Uncharacterized protein n=1 Tax=Daucus carota subsp. sativus TaxID=79200 RepID=A0AAF1ATE7_DAUCS|nr:PREDICTED: uncharacterized protein LOC108213563 [Daucus carota subsp. sativus]WOG92387.1 hypothetical protein DCAR_0311652 [Daucus carota subsp. sativus]